MKDLIVKLSGDIQESNFSEFKEIMLVKIKEADIPLVSDDDFYLAEKTVKIFKEAEDKISLAKHDAMRSTKNIAKLFESFDELSTELRKVRLSLNKKVTTEKANLKMQVVDSGCERFKKAIDEVANDLPEIHNAIAVSRKFFEDAVSGKRSIEKMEAAVDEVLEGNINNLTALQTLMVHNKGLIEKCEFKSLFPDMEHIISKPLSEVQSIIEGRVAKHQLAEKERKESEAEKAKAEEERKAAAESTPDPVEKQPDPPKPEHEPKKQEVSQKQGEVKASEEQAGNFVLTVNLSCVPSEAKKFASQVNVLIGSHSSVKKIGLVRA